MLRASGSTWRRELEWVDRIPRTDDEGCVYVVYFDDGTVKVGRSTKPASRVQSLASDESRRCSVKLVAISLPHVEWVKNETKLIKHCNREHEPFKGRERFIVNGLDLVIEYAEDLRKTRGTTSLDYDQVELRSMDDPSLIELHTKELNAHNAFLRDEIRLYEERTSTIVDSAIKERNYVRLLGVMGRAKRVNNGAYERLAAALPEMPRDPVPDEAYFYDANTNAFVRADWVDGATEWHVPVTACVDGVYYNQHFEFKPDEPEESRCKMCKRRFGEAERKGRPK